MEKKKTEYEKKTLEKMDVIDDFLFKEIMADEEFGLEVCRIILETVLGRKVGKIRFTPQKSVPGVSEKNHGIVMDVYINEENETGEVMNVHDIEPDKIFEKKKGLPKRARYYGDLIDIHLLKTNTDYEKLPELVVIFILSYDPFGENAMYYEAGSILKTHPHIPYNDGIRRIYLYTDGKLPEKATESDEKLKNLLKYIRNSIDENVTDDATKRLDDIVKSTKSNESVGIRYMKSWEIENMLREEGREEERENTERERQRADSESRRADNESQRADRAEARVKELEALLAAK